MVVTSLLCVSCQRGAIERSESLVGADDLPISSVLSQEIIQLNRGFGAYSSGNFLSYELRPDNSLTVTHTFRPKDEVRGVETFRLPAITAEHARRMLWRVRPAKLAGVESETRPMGCQQQGPHDLGELAVVFIKEGDKA